MLRFTIPFLFAIGCATESEYFAPAPPDGGSVDAGRIDVVPAADTAVASGPEVQIAIDVTGVDAIVPLDGLALPHDVSPVDGVPCMQQIVAAGYASDKSSCATWTIAKVSAPYTSQTACVALIDCYAANPACLSWYTTTDCDCIYRIPYHSADWVPLMDLITPFCPSFFTLK
jgi:hypothetical protein